MNSTVRRCGGYNSGLLEQPTRRAFAILLTVVSLITVAILDSGWNAVVSEETSSSRVTVIYKNQMHPSLGELKVRPAVTVQSDDANSDEGLVFQRRSQRI